MVAPPQRPVTSLSQPTPIPAEEEEEFRMHHLPETDLLPEGTIEIEEPGEDEDQFVVAGPEERDGYDEDLEFSPEEQFPVSAVPDNQTQVRRSSRERRPKQIFT